VNCGNNTLTGTSSTPYEIEEKWGMARARIFARVGAALGAALFIAANRTILKDMYLEDKYVLLGSSICAFVGYRLLHAIGKRPYLP